MGRWSREGRRYWPTVRMSHFAGGEVGEDVHQFGHAFAEADHHAGFGDLSSPSPPKISWRFRADAACARSARRSARRDRGAERIRCCDSARRGGRRARFCKRFVESLKIGDEDFDAAIGRDFAHLADGFGKNSGAAKVVVVAVHAGDDGVLQSQSCDGFGDAAGLIEIDRLRDGPWGRRRNRSGGCRCRPAA